MKTYSMKQDEISKDWLIVDVDARTVVPAGGTPSNRRQICAMPPSSM